MKVRKRTILAILATIFIVCATNSLWLISSPLVVDFDISAKSRGNTEVRLSHNVNKIYNNQDFSRINHLSYSIEKAKFHKKIKFYFSDLNNIFPITLRNITLRNGKAKLNNWKKFKLEGGKLEFKDNSLIIKPDYNFVVLTYNEPLNFIRTDFKFDFYIFVIIAVLSFLCMYKLTCYIADFKTIKNQSRIEIIFLAIFFVMLFIPMSKISQDDISRNENRRLAVWKPLITQNGQINYNFGKDFNDFFNDRFNFRENLLDLNTIFSVYTTGNVNSGYVDMKNKVSYLSPYRSSPVNEGAFNTLIQFDKFLNSNGIDLYILLVPDKYYISPPKPFRYHTKYDIEMDNKVKELNERSHLHIVHPLNALKKHANESYMYFKTEHHWTDDGAFIGYQELMKEITKKYPDIRILNYNDFDYSYNNLVRGDWGRDFRLGQDSWRLNLPKSVVEKLHQTDYRYFTQKDARLLQQEIIDEHFKKEKNYYFPKGANYRVIQLGTSQNENLTEFIPYTFKHVKRLRNNNVIDIPLEEEFKILKYYKNEILDYKPDIIIFCITYDNLGQLSSKIFDME